MNREESDASMVSALLPFILQFQCKVCLELLYEPVTLPCGNSICRRCFRAPCNSNLSKSGGLSIARQASCGSSSSSDTGSDACPMSRKDAQTSPGCSTQFDSSAHLTHSSQNCSESLKSANASSEVAMMNDVVASIGAYTCPIKSCRIKHRYRNEQVNIVIASCMEKLWPVEMDVMSKLKAGEDRLKQYWNPNKSICKDEGCLKSENNTMEKLAEKKDVADDLYDIIKSCIEPAIVNAPYLQLPFLLRAKVLAELGRFEEASNDAQHAATINHINRRGVIAGKLVAWRQRMFESKLHLLATCAISTLFSQDFQGSTESSVSATVKAAADELRREIFNVINEPNPEVIQQPIPQSMLYILNGLVQRLTSCSSFAIETPRNSIQAVFHTILSPSEIECTMCLSQIRSPLTCPCGHSWCRNCLIKSLDHSRHCPMCRQKLPQIGYYLCRPVDHTLDFLSRNALPTSPIPQSIADIPTNPIGSIEKIPIFIGFLVFPGMTQGFQFYEPRYRVMMKRCIEGNRRFGIVLPRPANSPGFPCMDFGTMVFIRHFEPLLNCDIVPTVEGNLPRYMTQILGLTRFKIHSLEPNEAGYLDGYVERFEDVEPEDRFFDVQDSVEGKPRMQNPKNQNWDPMELAALVHRARRFVKTLLATLSNEARLHFRRKHGEMPQDPADLSFWFTELFPLDPYTLYTLLPLTDATERMKIICNWIDQSQIVRS